MPDEGSAPARRTVLSDLVRPERVHRRVYADPDIFALEMERIFGRTWVFVGHTSQVPTPGDFVTTRIGLQPVIMVRHDDGRIHVVFNRCAHRGAQVCAAARGHAKRLRCLYHGWTYNTDGTLHSVPMRGGYTDLDARAPELGLKRVARIDDYRGFVFASLSADGPGLADTLGPIRSSIDDIVDRAPEGEVEFAGGMFRQISRSNWKLIVENANDMVHAGALHESANDAVMDVSTEGFDPPFGQHRVASLRANAAPLAQMDKSGTAAYPHGHSFIGGLPRPPRGGKVFTEYRARLAARHGEARADEILSVTRHLNLIYPNLLTNGFYGLIKVVQPLAVDLTEILVYPMRLKGAPDELFHTTVNMVNNTGSCSGMALSDDLEIYRRCQQGYSAEEVDWIDLSRGAGQDVPDNQGGFTASGTSELPMRNQFRAWLDYMSVED